MNRFLPLMAMLALLIAPFGRMGMAEAMASRHHAVPMATAGHCADLPAPDRNKPDKTRVDCMIACAAIAPMPPFQMAPIVVPAAIPGATAATAFHGLHPGADPPPPRFA